jgi:hypothetical protein
MHCFSLCCVTTRSVSINTPPFIRLTESLGGRSVDREFFFAHKRREYTLMPWVGFEPAVRSFKSRKRRSQLTSNVVRVCTETTTLFISNSTTYLLIPSDQKNVCVPDDHNTLGYLTQSDCLAADCQGQGDTRVTLTPSVIPNSNYIIMVSGWNCLKYFACFCTVTIRCIENFWSFCIYRMAQEALDLVVLPTIC